MARSAPRRIACSLLAALMLLTAVEASGASVRIFRRFAVLSFDSGATQLADELACESSVTPRTGESDASTRLVARPSGRLAALVDAPPRAGLEITFIGLLVATIVVYHIWLDHRAPGRAERGALRSSRRAPSPSRTPPSPTVP